MTNATLAVGPLSSRIIEATFEYSEQHNVELMLIASRNQIDVHGGYVNNWTTRAYMHFISNMKALYPNSKVLVCRDHCGPGFKDGIKDTIESTYETVETDIKLGFDLIHIDLCRSELTQDDKIAESKRLMEFGLKINPNIMFEVGTDENDGCSFANTETVESNIKSIIEVAKPEFYVLQTGSLIKEAKQVGHFEKKLVSKFSELLSTYDVKIKEHNADYLTHGQIKERTGLVGAMNIAPQLGVIQTSTILNLCLIHGISLEAFMRLVHEQGRWKKWSLGHLDNHYASTLVAGHYHFCHEEYQRIEAQLSEYVNLSDVIVQSIKNVIGHYLSAF